jgi:hypothetical protein
VSAARYLSLAKRHTPFSFTVIADGLFLSSGLLNVLLYVYTRPFLLPHSDSPDNQSIAIHSEFAQSRSDIPVLGSTRVVERDPSPFEPKSADPVYDAPEMAHLQDGTPPIITHAGDRNIGHSYGEALVRRAIFDDV